MAKEISIIKHKIITLHLLHISTRQFTLQKIELSQGTGTANSDLKAAFRLQRPLLALGPQKHVENCSLSEELLQSVD